jgi:hypothetical protein
MKHDPAKDELALPQPVAVRIERPAAVRDVRRKIAPDDLSMGHPHRAELRVMNEVPVRLELASKRSEGARIAVGVFAFGRDLVMARRVVRSRRAIGAERVGARP